MHRDELFGQDRLIHKRDHPGATRDQRASPGCVTSADEHDVIFWYANVWNPPVGKLRRTQTKYELPTEYADGCSRGRPHFSQHRATLAKVHGAGRHRDLGRAWAASPEGEDTRGRSCREGRWHSIERVYLDRRRMFPLDDTGYATSKKRLAPLQKPEALTGRIASKRRTGRSWPTSSSALGQTLAVA